MREDSSPDGCGNPHQLEDELPFESMFLCQFMRPNHCFSMLTESLEDSNGQNGKSRVGVLPMKYSSRRIIYIYIYIRSIYTLILSYTDHVYTYMYINNIYI